MDKHTYRVTTLVETEYYKSEQKFDINMPQNCLNAGSSQESSYKENNTNKAEKSIFETNVQNIIVKFI